MNEKQHALAAEIRAEMAAQRIPATEMQRRAGIKHASWRNWFVTASRPVPYPELEAVCRVLGVKLSVLLARAEARQQSTPVDPVDAQLEAMLSPGARRVVEEERARVRREQRGEADAEDPPDAATKGRRSA